MCVDRKTYREAMAQLGAAVNVITSIGPDGLYGMTASAVCSITDDPPTLAVCVNRASHSNAVFKTNGVLCVNTLNGAQQDISAIFAGATRCSVKERFDAGTWTCLVTGSPVLIDAAASFDCRITETVEKGTHTIFFAQVVATHQSQVRAGCLVYCRRSYHQVARESLAELTT